MRKSSHHIQFWLGEKDYEKLTMAIDKSGLSMTAYFRQLINGFIPTDLPPPDYYSMMNELRKIGVNINQIAYKTNATGAVDSEYYKKEAEKLNEAIIKISEAVMLARRL